MMARLRDLLRYTGSKTTLLLTIFTMVAVLLLMANQVQAAGTLYLTAKSNSLYTVNTTTAITTTLGTGLCEGLALSENPSTFLYCVNDFDGILYTVATDGSGRTPLTALGCGRDRGLAYNTATGILYGADDGGLSSINTTTGACTTLAALPGNQDTEALAADPDNNLIYGLGNNSNLYVYNVGLNSWSTVGLTSVSSGDDAGLAFDPIDNILYAIEANDNVWSINPANAATTFIGNVGGIGSDYGLTFLPSDIIPTMNEWGMIIFMVLAGLGSIYYLAYRQAGLRRQRRARS
jgi:hypothetical protein